MSVNRPTNVKQKEADVNQKLQLYGIYSAFANGKVPSNKQIDIALNSFIASDLLSKPSPKLSEEGRHLIADARNVVEQAKVLLLSKNEGNLLQDFIWQTGQLSTGAAKLPGAPVDKDTATQHGNQALEGLRTLGTLVLSNGQFRKLLSDATVLLRDIAGDAAQKTATKINPSEDALAQIDAPAEDNTWHDVPNLSPAELKAQAQNKYNSKKPFNRNDVKAAAGDASGAATGTRDPAEAGTVASDQGGAGVDARGGANAAMNRLRDTTSANVPDDQKDAARDTAREYQNRTKGYLQEKVPKERRDQTIYRLKKMIVEIQSHSDYQSAIETLLSLAEEYGGHSKNLTQQGAGSIKGAHTDTALTTAEADLKTLLERFANSTSADDLIDSINTMYRDADRDPELKGWFTSLDRYIRKCLQQSGYIMQDEANDEWNALYDKGNFLLRDRYKNHTDRVLDEFKFFGQQFDEDPQNKRFAATMQKLFTDLGNDENGKPTFKPHLLKDLSNVIVPDLFERVRYVPVPRIEYTDPQMDAIIENLVIESDNLAPNSFEFGSDNYFRWGRKTVTSANKNKVMVSVSGVQMDLKDVSYYVHKKQGFPSLKDTGVMDIFMGGSGFSFKIAMETVDKSDRQHFFKINKVTVDIKSLTIKLKQSKHKLMFNLFRPLLFAILRPAVGKVLEKLIKDQVHELDAKAYAIHQEAQRAAQAVQNDPENAPNIYSRYVNAAQTTFMKNRKKAEEATADKKGNVAMTQMDSIFPDIKLPGGISTKATEYKQLAAKGDKWESPVFGIGSASESTNIPRVTKVTRKPHDVTSGGVRGAQNLESGQSGHGQAQPRTYHSNTAGFGNEVNQAFGTGNDLSLKGTGPTANGGISDGTTGITNGAGIGGTTTHTTLGINNPVLSGSA